MNVLENSATAAVNNTDPVKLEADLMAAALTGRKENFARLFNPKLATILEKRDEVKRMADRPQLFHGVITQAHVDRVEETLEQIKSDIVAALEVLRDYTPATEEAERPLRKKPSFDLFDM